MKVVLILGMHRSGTSCFAQMLSRAGVPFGGPLLTESRPDNPDGYWEHAEVVAIHEELLDLLGRALGTPDAALEYPRDWLLWPETLSAKARLADVIRREVEAQGLWAVKDPRLMRFLPLWREILDDLSLPFATVLCLRNPDEVAASLSVRNGFDRPRGLALWVRHSADVMHDLPAGPDAVVDYDDLFERPVETLRAVAARLGLDRPAVAVAAGCLRPELRHHRLPLPNDPESAEASRLYSKLRRFAESGQWAPAPAPAIRAPGPKVSIIMRTRDRTLFLPRAMRSILGQTHTNWQLLVVNDGGPAAPVEAALAPYRPALGSRLVLVHWPEPRGMEAASNAAIALADGDYLVVHDDDDSWRPTFLETCLAHLTATGAAGVVTRTMIVRERVENGKAVTVGEEPFMPELAGIHFHESLSANRVPPIAFVFGRKVIAEIGPFREDYPVLGDWEFSLRFLARYPIALLDEPLARLHRRPADDPFPNSRLDQHRRMQHVLRDDLLRHAKTPGEAAAALVPTLGVMLERLLDQTASRLEARLPAPAVHTLPPAGRFPDFLCIGAQRSGTTWLYRNLCGHPDLWLPPFKEIHYFDQRFGPDRTIGPRMRLNYLRDGLAERQATLAAGDSDGEVRRWLEWAGPFATSREVDDAWYARLFSSAPPEAKVGEITPAYAVLPDAGVAHVKRLMPDLRILFLMRDPVDRMVSGAVNRLTTVAGTNELPPLNTLLAEIESDHCRSRSDYRRTIETWERHFPAHQIHYGFFDDIVAPPQEVCRDICRHLGIGYDASFFSEAAKVVNAGIRLPAADLAAAYDRAADLCRDDLSWLVERFGGRVAEWGRRPR